MKRNGRSFLAEHRRLIFIGVIPACALIAVAGLVTAQFWRILSVPGFATAKRLWAARPFLRYRMALDLLSDTGMTCRQEAEIKDEKVVTLYDNTCRRRAGTITSLFDEIEFYAKNNHCRANGMVVVQVVYDYQWGYPRQIDVHLSNHALWLNPDYWGQWLLRGGCSTFGFAGMQVKVTSLAPISPP
ncbi:MAG: hypothetical protein HY260_12160 [Chloroflexi bacterium]|nr:hypothetical protein [Chloroflexota bacterium]